MKTPYNSTSGRHLFLAKFFLTGACGIKLKDEKLYFLSPSFLVGLEGIGGVIRNSTTFSLASFYWLRTADWGGGGSGERLGRELGRNGEIFSENQENCVY